METEKVDVQPWDESRLLEAEKDALGFYISGHPMARYRKTLSKMKVSPISEVADSHDLAEGEFANNRAYPEERTEVVIAGIISDMKTRAKEKSVTAYIQIEDETGSTESLAFSDLYRKYAELLKKGSVIIIRGQLTRAEKGAKVIAREITDISGMEIAVKYEVLLRGDREDALDKLKGIRALVDSTPKGKESGSFQLRLIMKDFCVVLISPLHTCPNFGAEIERLTGEKVRIY
jgi:DNA polymerase-3 subunit alpha